MNASFCRSVSSASTLLLAAILGAQEAPTPEAVQRPEHLRPASGMLLAAGETASARSALARGLPSKALFHLDQALLLQPGSPRLHALRGRALADLGRHRDAVAAYRWALDSVDDLPREEREGYPRGSWETALARALLRLGAGSSAEEALDRAEALGVPPTDLTVERAWVDLLSGRTEEAEDVAADLVGSANPPEVAFLVLAEARLVQDDPEGALRALEGRTDAGAEAVRARALEALGRNEEAEAARVRAEEGRTVEGRRVLYEAVRAVEAGDLDQAESSLAEAAAGLGEDPLVEVWRGVVAQRRGDPMEARRSFRRALSLDPASPGALEGLADLAVVRGDYAAALAWARAAVRRDPDSSVLRRKLGSIYTGLGRLNDAQDAYLAAQALAPADPAPLLALAALHEALGRTMLAQVLTRQAQRLAGGPPGRPAPPESAVSGD